MKFILYIIYVIILSLLNIVWGNAVSFAISCFYFTIFILSLLLSCILYGLSLTKLLFFKAILTTIYLPIIIYGLFKLSVFLTDYFDKFNPPC